MPLLYWFYMNAGIIEVFFQKIISNNIEITYKILTSSSTQAGGVLKERSGKRSYRESLWSTQSPAGGFLTNILSQITDTFS